jgi:DNA polymerase-3 subunit delta'
VSAGAFLDQQGARRVLDQCLESGQVPPALLFAGPGGTGKEEAAIAFAQALNCDSRREPDTPPDLFGDPVPQPMLTDLTGLGGCGICSSCNRIGRYAYPDVIVRLPLPRPRGNPRDPADPSEALAFKGEHPWRDPIIEGSLSIGIADVRAVIAQLAFPPSEGERRVVILREAERMTDEAQNALLKSLEEPPSHTVFILTTHQPERLRPTVRSRCQRVSFGPLPDGVIEDYLKEAGIESPDGTLPPAVARGNLKRAILVAEEGVAGREEALQLLRWAAHGELLQVLDYAAAFTFKSGGSALADARNVLEELVSLTRDLAAMASGGLPHLHNRTRRSCCAP